MADDLPPPAATVKPPRRRRGLRRAATALAATGLALPLVLAAALAVALGVALHSTAGSAWLLRQVPGLTLDAPRGALLGGDGFGAARLRYADAQGHEVQATDVVFGPPLTWRLRPAPGQWLGLKLVGLRIDHLHLRLPPAAAPLAAPTDLRLPLALDLPDVRIARLQVDDRPPVEALRADVQLGAEGGHRHRLRALDLRWQGHAVQAQGQVGSTGDLPLQLQARVTSPTTAAATGASAWPGWRALAELAGPLAAPALTLSLQPMARDGTTPPGDGPSLQLQAGLQPFADWPLGTLDARLRGLDLHALWPDLPRTRLDGEARLQSTGLQAPAALTLSLTNAQPGRWDAGRLPLRRLALTAAGRLDDRSRFDLQALDLQAADERRDLGRLQAEGDWTREALRLDTTLQALEPAGLDARLPALRLSGPLALRLAGWPPPGDRSSPAAEKRLSLDGRLEGAVLSMPQTPTARLTLQAEGRQAADGAWSLALRQGVAQAGDAEAQARLDASGQAGRWQVQGEGRLRRFDPAAWWPAAGSGHRLDGRWQADLQGRTPAAMGSASAPTPLALLESLRRQTQPVSGRLALDLDDGRLAGVPLRGRLAWQRQAVGQAANAEVALQAAGGNTLQLQARLAVDASAPDQASGRLELPDAAALAAWARLDPALAALWPQAGRLVLEGRTEGRWPALRSDGRAEADGLAAAGWRIDRGRARWQLDGADLDGRLEATAELDGVASATPRGEPARRLERVTLALAGSRADHGLRVEARSAVRPPAWAEPLLGPGGGAGGTAFTLDGRGRWTPVAGGARWEGRLARLRSGPVRADATPWLAADDLAALLHFDPAFGLISAELAPGRLQVVGSSLRWQLARWQAAPPGAPAGHGELRLQAQLDPLPLAPLLARWQPDFGWGGDLVVAGRADLRSGAGVEAEVLLERRSGDLTVTDEGGTTGLGLSELRLGLSARGGTWHFTQALAGSTVGVLAGSQTLRTDPRATWPAPTTPLAGAIELRVDNLGVWGPWTPVGWRLGGALHARATLGGTAGAPQYTGRIDGQDLSARHLLQGVSLREGRLALRLAGETAQVEQFSLRGGDGWLHVGGDIAFGEAPQARLTLRADRFQALGRLDRRVVVSGDARMALDRRALALDGRLTVDEGLLDVSRGDAPALDGDVTVVRRAASAAPVAEELPPAVPRETQVRLAVDLGPQLRVRGRGLNALLRGDLQLTTPGGRLRINGTVRADEGTYTAYGQNLRIDRGLVTFIGNPENPRLDILALREQVDVRVGVAVTGSVLRPRVRLYSEPDMPDPEKLSWLVLGRAPEGVGRSDTALLQRAALALLSGEGDGSPSATDRLTRGLGLDDITLRQSADNDVRSTVVGVGKQLTRRWYVGYERGINSTTGTWQLIYRIAQRFTLRTQAGEDPAVDLLWIWRWNGRGIPPPSALLPSRPPRPAGSGSTPSP